MICFFERLLEANAGHRVRGFSISLYTPLHVLTILLKCEGPLLYAPCARNIRLSGGVDLNLVSDLSLSFQDEIQISIIIFHGNQ